jgi:hypothetical protein
MSSFKRGDRAFVTFPKRQIGTILSFHGSVEGLWATVAFDDGTQFEYLERHLVWVSGTEPAVSAASVAEEKAIIDELLDAEIKKIEARLSIVQRMKEQNRG